MKYNCVEYNGCLADSKGTYTSKDDCTTSCSYTRDCDSIISTIPNFKEMCNSCYTSIDPLYDCNNLLQLNEDFFKDSETVNTCGSQFITIEICKTKKPYCNDGDNAGHNGLNGCMLARLNSINSNTNIPIAFPPTYTNTDPRTVFLNNILLTNNNTTCDMSKYQTTSDFKIQLSSYSDNNSDENNMRYKHDYYCNIGQLPDRCYRSYSDIPCSFTGCDLSSSYWYLTPGLSVVYPEPTSGTYSTTWKLGKSNITVGDYNTRSITSLIPTNTSLTDTAIICKGHGTSSQIDCTSTIMPLTTEDNFNNHVLINSVYISPLNCYVNYQNSSSQDKFMGRFETGGMYYVNNDDMYANNTAQLPPAPTPAPTPAPSPQLYSCQSNTSCVTSSDGTYYKNSCDIYCKKPVSIPIPSTPGQLMYSCGSNGSCTSSTNGTYYKNSCNIYC